MTSIATLKLIGYGVGALAVIALLAMVNGWRVERNHLRDWQTTVVAATRDASANPRLGKDAVARQISDMGITITGLKAAIADQNAKVAELGKASAQQQAEAAQASRSAQERAGKAEATSRRLSASAAHSASGGLSGACEPSKALTEAWKGQ